MIDYRATITPERLSKITGYHVTSISWKDYPEHVLKTVIVEYDIVPGAPTLKINTTPITIPDSETLDRLVGWMISERSEKAADDLVEHDRDDDGA